MTIAGAMLLAAPADATLVTYHVNATSQDSTFGVPGGLPLVLEFTVDDATPASFTSTEHSEYLGAIVGGFVRFAGATLQLGGFSLVSIFDNAGGSLDLYQVVASFAPADPLSGFGHPDLVTFLMLTNGANPGVLNGTALATPILPASAFDSANLQMQFVEGDGFNATITAGPLPGPALAAEPPMPALVLAALALLGWRLRIRKRSGAQPRYSGSGRVNQSCRIA